MYTPIHAQQLPTTEQLLVSGGDERIALDNIHGVNRYGCPPLAVPGLLDFGSCTASVISAGAFQATDELRRRLQSELHDRTPAVIYDRELDRIRGQLFQLSELGDLVEPDVIFAASGTDLHRIAVLLSHAATTRPVLALMVEEAETGSGVHDALINSRFGTEVSTVAMREADGRPRSTNDIDADFERIAREAILQGFHVLLVQVDQSKTGMIAPSYTCTEKLQLALGTQLDILIDACQYRISPATLRSCLARGYSVALTGSKFVSGPSFSGALMIPAQIAARLRELPFPKELSGICLAGEWPVGWAARDVLNNASNLGLLLRWEAALYELRAFRTLHNTDIKNFLQDFAIHIKTFMQQQSLIESVPVPALERSPLITSDDWDTEQSTFPFYLYAQTANGMSLQNAQALRDIYKNLPDAKIGCQLGQPVRLAEGRYALRLCLSARSIVEALKYGEPSKQRIKADAIKVLEQTLELSRKSQHVTTHELPQCTPSTSSCMH